MPRHAQASDRTERIVIKSPSTVADNQGGRSTSWATLKTVWAEVRSLTARETVAAKAAASKTRYEVSMALHDGVGVLPTMRIEWTPSWSSSEATRTLEIYGGRPDRPRGLYLFDCGEGT